MLSIVAIAFLSVSIVLAVVLTGASAQQPDVEVKISREEAITIATPIVEEFAEKHSLKIKSVEAEIVYFVESKWLEYPVWGVKFSFEENPRFLGYWVAVLVDTGEIVHTEPRPRIAGTESSNSKVSPLTAASIAAPIGVGLLLSGVGIYKCSRRKHKA